MKIFVTLLVFLFCSILFAQPEINNKGGVPLKMKPLKPEINKKEVLNEPEPLLKTEKLAPFETPKKPTVDLFKKKEFANPNIQFTKKLNNTITEDQYIGELSGNKFYGDFKRNTLFVKIACRDFGQVDGDRVSVYLNEKLVAQDITLYESFNELKLNLLNGFNKIEFQALNQGTSGPNTAEFIIFDDKGKLITSNQWNLLTGSKASIIVVKE